MGAKSRTDSTIDFLPLEIRQEIDNRLKDNRISFKSIVQWVNDSGHDISYSAFIRYVKRTNKAAQRMADAVIRTQAIAEAAKNMPDIDFTKASQLLFMDGLVQRISNSPEEFAEIPIEKAGRLVTAIQRNAIAERKVEIDAKSKAALALDQMLDDFKEVFAADKKLAAEFVKIIDKIKARAEKLAEEKEV